MEVLQISRSCAFSTRFSSFTEEIDPIAVFALEPAGERGQNQLHGDHDDNLADPDAV